MRVILREDSELLTFSETKAMGHSAKRVLCASGAARGIARELLGSMGLGQRDILKSPDGAPIWPAGIVGSLTHDSVMAAAIVAKAQAISGVGIDIEPSEDIEEQVVHLVGSESERNQLKTTHSGTRHYSVSKRQRLRPFSPEIPFSWISKMWLWMLARKPRLLLMAEELYGGSCANRA